MHRPRSFIGPQGMGGMVGLWTAPSLIRNIQRGTIALSNTVLTNTATVSAYVLANSILRWLGESSDSANTATSPGYHDLARTNETTITATRVDGTGTTVVNYELVEYAPGVIKSNQSGITAANSTSSITAVDTSKSVVIWTGHNGTGAAYTNTGGLTRVTLTNSTTITTVGGAPSTAWQVVEFY